MPNLSAKRVGSHPRRLAGPLEHPTRSLRSAIDTEALDRELVPEEKGLRNDGTDHTGPNNRAMVTIKCTLLPIN